MNKTSLFPAILNFYAASHIVNGEENYETFTSPLKTAYLLSKNFNLK